MDQLGRKLKELREERRLTQRAAAQRLGISNTRLSEFELGKTRSTGLPAIPKRALVLAMAELYGFPSDVLLALAGYPVTEPTVPPVPSKEEAEVRELAEIFRLLDDQQRRLLLVVARALRAEKLDQAHTP